MLRVAWRNLLAHKVRLSLSAAAVVLGVAFVSGTLVFTDTLQRTFADLFATTSADVNVTPRAAFATGLTGTSMGGTRPSLPASLVGRVREVEGVAGAEGYVESEGVYVLDAGGDVVDTAGAPGVGTSWSNVPEVSVITLVEGRAPAGPREIALDTGTVATTGFEVGDTVTLLTTGPRLRAELVGVVRYGDEGGLAGASLTVFDVVTAQQLLLEPGRYTGISVAAADGQDHDALRDRVAAVVGARYDVSTAAEYSEDLAASLREELRFIDIVLLVFAGVALFVGSFLILNTFSMLVAERTRELALFRALGASQRQTTNSVLLEALVLALVGATTGLAGGYGLALALRSLFGRLGLTLDGGLVVDADTVAWSLGIGVAVTTVAAYLPARRAARVPPVAALNPDLRTTDGSLRRRLLLGGPLAVAGGAALALAPVAGTEPAVALATTGGAALVAGAIALSPVLAGPLIRLLGSPLPRLAGTTGRLARENALRNPRRTAATSAALMIGLALVTAFSILGSSMKASIDAVIGDTMQADYVASTAVGQPFSADVGDRLAAVDGVESVTRTRFGTALFDEHRSLFVAYDAATVDASLDVEFVDGSFDDLAGDGLLVDEAVAAEHGWGLGSRVRFLVPSGQSRDLVVGGTFRRNNALGTYLVSMETYDETGGVPLDRYVYINLADQVRVAAVEEDLRDVADAYPVVDLKTAADFRDEQRGRVDDILLLVNALLVLSVLIAVLGVVNTLVLSVLERTREIGLLRAVGLDRRQVRRMVRLEALLISCYGAALGVVVGTAFGAGVTRAMRGYGIDLVVVPWGQLAIFLLLGGVVGVVAAALPARRAARLEVLEAIAST